MASLVDLPAELLSRIASHLFCQDPVSHGTFKDDGFCSLRLSCRSLSPRNIRLPRLPILLDSESRASARSPALIAELRQRKCVFCTSSYFYRNRSSFTKSAASGNQRQRKQRQQVSPDERVRVT